MAEQTTRCCVVGGGPAGMMLGFLLARAGIDVIVLEKHADFLRDFRGDTIHPSTLEMMHELGLLSEFLKLPHSEVSRLRAQFGELEFEVADLAHLPTRCKFIAMMPQWDFLNFLAEQGRRYADSFRLMMSTEATGLIIENDRVVGVKASSAQGPVAIHTALVVGCDGRHSTVRQAAGFKVEALGAPMDVAWFRIERRPTDPEEIMGRFGHGRIAILINRGSYWQCAYVIPKGTFDEVRRQGLDKFRADVARAVPLFAGRLDEIDDWDKVKLLTVAVDRLRQWHRPGLICIGDAAHAMSPIGGVGVNLAIQDAVAAANILIEPLRQGTVTSDVLDRVQRRREWPTRVTQRIQLVMQDTVVRGVLTEGEAFEPPVAVRLLQRFPWLRRIPARLLTVGVRPEHIGTPERRSA